MPLVARITVFPFKSCDGVDCQNAIVLPSGALMHDRQFALVDATGRFINAKRTPLIQRLQVRIDPATREYRVSQRHQNEECRGRLDEDGKQLSDWLSQYFSFDVSIVENDETGFPDDLDAGGPTVVSTSTLQTVTEWFPELTIDEVRSRFRANIEIGGVEPFWEDRLFREDKQPQPFRIGSVLFGGINPCQRCVVPTRDSKSGDVEPQSFAQQFRQRREKALPPWSPRQRFDHFYRLSTNTICLDRGDSAIKCGDPVELI